MLLAYDKTSGAVLWNSGTNTAYPLGPPDFVAHEATGRTDVGLIRLDDDRDDATVAKVFTNVITVSAGKILVGPPIGSDPGPTVPVSPATAEQLMNLINALQAQQDALTAQQAALQGQSDDLMLMMFGGVGE